MAGIFSDDVSILYLISTHCFYVISAGDGNISQKFELSVDEGGSEAPTEPSNKVTASHQTIMSL